MPRTYVKNAPRYNYQLLKWIYSLVQELPVFKVVVKILRSSPFKFEPQLNVRNLYDINHNLMYYKSCLI